MTPVYPRTKVTVIQKGGNALLVQYMTSGFTERKYIPADQLGDGQVLASVLEQGIPYGYPFEEIQIEFDARKFANELHQIDIWTPDDALRNPQKLWTALNATYADNISKILETARHEKKGVKQND